MGKKTWLHALAKKAKVVRYVSGGALVVLTLVIAIVEAISARKKEAEDAGE